MTGYYRTKSPGCVDDVLAQLRQMAASGRAEPNTIIGFLAEVFQTSPQERAHALKAEPSDYVRSIDLFSLYQAGLPDDARSFAAANNLSALSEKLLARHIVPLETLRPSSIPAENDMLIGAYMASGNADFIHRILDNYSSADDGMASDGLRIGFMMSKFGPNLTPKGRDSVMIHSVCTKYQCQIEQTKFLRVMTLATALWSLQSLSQNDEGIKKALSEFFTHDPRLKALFLTEQAAFGNYLAAIVFTTAFKDNHATADRERPYAEMSKSASIYENLGLAKDAFAPFTTLKK
jgi:hypothetical protein